MLIHLHSAPPDWLIYLCKNDAVEGAGITINYGHKSECLRMAKWVRVDRLRLRLQVPVIG